MSGDSSIKDEKKNVELVEQICVKVNAQDGSVVQFKTKKTSSLKKLMHTYCERKNMSIANVRFRFDGSVINASTTPKELGMEDGDTIEVFQEQLGGSRNIEHCCRPATVCAN